jgi:hypothetical protein
MTTTAPITSTIPAAKRDMERTEAGTPPAHRTPASTPRGRVDRRGNTAAALC